MRIFYIYKAMDNYDALKLVGGGRRAKKKKRRRRKKEEEMKKKTKEEEEERSLSFFLYQLFNYYKIIRMLMNSLIEQSTIAGIENIF